VKNITHCILIEIPVHVNVYNTVWNLLINFDKGVIILYSVHHDEFTV